MKRILFVVPLPPPTHGSSMMCNYIKESNLINNTFECHYINISASRNTNEIQKFSIKKIFRLLFSIFSLLSMLVKNKYDTCYLSTSCFGIPFLKDLPFIILCKLFCKNIIIHHHNKGMKKYSSKILFRQLYKHTYKNTKVILLSDILYNDVSDIINEKQIRICPNGIPDQNMYSTINNDNKILKLLLISNLIESKGIYELLDVCKNIVDKGYKVSCSIIGNESKSITKNKLENEISKRQLKNIVRYEGPKYGNEKLQYLYNADIFIFLTHYEQECFPLVILEALQFGIPCISSYEGAIPEIIKDNYNGILCHYNDIEKASNFIINLIEDRNQLITMKINSRKEYERNYNLNLFEKRITNILNE